ncbi:hypothetical protein IJI99_00490 [bacterium]|nr:hypothetical protein [bacterium]
MPGKNNNIKKIIYLLLISIIILLVVIIVNTHKKPADIPQEFFIPISDNPTSNFSQPQFIGDIPALPQELPTLTLIKNSNPNFYNRLNSFCQITQTEDYYHLGNRCYYYTYDTNSPQISMKEQNYNSQTIDVSLAEQSALSFINNLHNQQSSNYIITGYYLEDSNLTAEIETDLEEYIPQINNYYDDTLPKEEIATENPTSTAVNFSYTLGYQNIPIVQRDKNQNTMAIIVDSDYNVSWAELDANSYEILENSDSYQIIDIQTALNNIAQDEAFITYYYDNGDHDINAIRSLNNISFNKVSLEYHLLDNNRLAIPCYHFTGTSTNSNNNLINVEIVTPAINFTVIN